MNRKYTMDVAAVMERARNIQSVQDDAGCTSDDLIRMKYRLLWDLAKSIADSTCADPQGCAIIVTNEVPR